MPSLVTKSATNASSLRSSAKMPISTHRCSRLADTASRCNRFIRTMCTPAALRHELTRPLRGLIRLAVPAWANPQTLIKGGKRLGIRGFWFRPTLHCTINHACLPVCYMPTPGLSVKLTDNSLIGTPVWGGNGSTAGFFNSGGTLYELKLHDWDNSARSAIRSRRTRASASSEASGAPH